MRTTFITISLTLLPFFFPFFDPAPAPTNADSTHFDHQHCLHAFADQQGSHQIAFGRELGKYIKENAALDGNYALKTIVIDPGHGGRDPGTSGRYSREKHLTLKIARLLGELLKTAYPDLNIIFTRTDDTFVPLHLRASVANKNQADLFLSIHCNFMPNSSQTKGTETYVMGLHTTEYNLEVAKRENASILLEENYSSNYGGYDPNSPEGHIILSMFQNAFLERSISFADKLENRFSRSGNRHSRGVKQAGFAVLKSTTMPSVLVETGFLSNSEEEKFLTTTDGQLTIARSIAEAFTEYKNEVEGNNDPLPRLTARAPLLGNAPSSGGTPAEQPTHESADASPPSGPTPLEPAISPQPELALPSEPVNLAPENPSDAPITYKVLVLNTPDPASVRHLPWEKVRDLIEIKKSGATYTYYATGFGGYEEAVQSKTTLRNLGFGEAFVVAFQNGKRIPVSQNRENSKR